MKGTLSVVAVLCAGLLCTSAFSQIVTGNITVRAQDTSGAVIPGTEVTISSPAMIGGSRKELTDETGSYRFTLLPPGTYRVSFALPGFKTLNIDGVLLTAGSTATTVGSLEVSATAEEVTVNSQAPTIDLESATIGVNINQKMMDDLPWSHSVLGMGMMIPGVFSTSLDISNSLFGTSAVPNVRSGGRSGGNLVMVDGLLWCQSYSNYGSFEEVNVSTNAKGADQMNSGVSIALIPKTGGNTLHASFTGKYQNGSMQSDNVTQDLLDRGYAAGSNKFTHFTDYWGDIGGPILKDKFWFYGAYRAGYQGTFIPGYRTAVGGPLGVFYTTLRNQSAKLTYQLSSRQKLDVFLSMNTKNQPYRGATALVPAEATNSQGSWFGEGPVLTYTNTIDSKTSLSVKILRGGHWTTHDPLGFNGPGFEGLGPNIAQLINGSLVSQRIPTLPWVGFNNVGVRISDNTTGATDGGWGAGGGNANYERPIRWQENVDLSRFATIGGRKHELKVGYMGLWDKDYSIFLGSPYYEQFIYRSLPTETCPNSEICSNLFQHPYRITVYDSPNTTADIVKYRAAYANDKLSLSRKLTLNVGLRWDWSTSMLPPQGNDGSGPWSQKFNITKNQNFITNGDGSTTSYPVYSLLSPRLSFAYDVLGNGKIAIKGSYGRYTSPSDLPGGLLPGPGEPSTGGNPIATAACTYNNWDGTIPFDARRNFGADRLMGTADDINLSASCAKTTVLNGQIVPLTIYHFDPNLKTAYVSEYTAGLEIGFNQDYSLRLNVQRKFDRNGNKTINVNTPYSAYTDLTSADDPGRDGRICAGGPFASAGVATPCTAGGTNWDADNNPSGKLYYYSVPTNYPGRTDTNVLYKATCDANNHEGCSSYTAYTLTFNKNYSQRWQFVTAYDLDMAHSVPTNPETPNAVISNSKLSPVTWNQSFKMSGTYGVPDIPLLFGFKLTGLQYASSYLTQSGAWYPRSAQVNDIRGSAQSITMEPHVGRFPWVRDWDQSFRKKFKIREKQSLEFTWELYNSLNSNMVSAWRSTSTASSTYLQPDVKDAAGRVTQYGVPLRPSVILTPRIYEWGVAYKF